MPEPVSHPADGNAVARIADELGLSLEYERGEFARVRPVVEAWLNDRIADPIERAAFLAWIEERWCRGGVSGTTSTLPRVGPKRSRTHRYGDWRLPHPGNDVGA